MAARLIQVSVLLLLAALSSEAVKIGSTSTEQEDGDSSTPRKASAVSKSKIAKSAPQEPIDEAPPSDSPSDQQRMKAQRRLMIVGSLNVDLTCEVARLPGPGENILASNPNMTKALGGKGANQAIAAARLAQGSQLSAEFVCQFGEDAHAPWLRGVLERNGCELGACGNASGYSSGTGLVLLEPNGGVSAVVVAGSNAAWVEDDARALVDRVRGASALMLQREIPEFVNSILATAAHEAGVPVIQDVGGEDRPMADALLARLSYVCPNESELARLTGMAVGTVEEAIAAARALQAKGAQAVLVTLGSRGAFLLSPDGSLVEQGTCPIPRGGQVVDETGAGDAFRAAFAVALVEGRPLADCLRFAAAAGAIAVSVRGAEPSLPTRQQADALSASGGCRATVRRDEATSTVKVLSPSPNPPAAASSPAAADTSAAPRALHGPSAYDGFPLQFASRLNSMKDRIDLWNGTNDVLGWVARQGTVAGLELVDFNYPQHLRALSVSEVKGALSEAGLRAGAVALRYEKEHQAGAFTHPDARMRQKAIDLTKEGAQWAVDLGAGELIVWSAFDGYDYHHQADYHALWRRVVDAFREVCDAYPQVRVSLEFKPTDENTRFFAVPSTGAAMLLAHHVNRSNFGLTLDIGHMIMAGENPAQSVAMVGGAKKLFGVQLNDGHAKLGAEDGLMFGSVHPQMALEFIRWLQKVEYDGHLYFDTFPRNEDPVREAAYNIRRVKALWKQAELLTRRGIEEIQARSDAMGALELIEALEGELP